MARILGSGAGPGSLLFQALSPRAPAPSLAAVALGDALYRFEAPERPVVLLELQKQAKAGFKHRLFAQTARFLQLHPQGPHLEVDVELPNRRLRFGPVEMPLQLEAFLADAHWLSLAELGQRSSQIRLPSLDGSTHADQHRPSRALWEAVRAGHSPNRG